MNIEGLPRLDELGDELTRTTAWQRWQPLPMPYIYAAGFIVAWDCGLVWLCPLFLVLVFSACSTSAHDVLHGSLGLSRRATEWALFLLGAPILESGHAYRLTHLQHHRMFPSDEDIEGQAAHMPMWKVLVSGPAFLPRLWLWAFQKSARIRAQRRWLLIEVLLPAEAIALGLALLRWESGLLAYGVAVLISSWFYPLFAVHLPHLGFGERRVNQAWTLRGRLIPRLFRPLAFHLEHHLYPAVPSHNLPVLAQRLEPYLREQEIRLIHVP